MVQVSGTFVGLLEFGFELFRGRPRQSNAVQDLSLVGSFAGVGARNVHVQAFPATKDGYNDRKDRNVNFNQCLYGIMVLVSARIQVCLRTSKSWRNYRTTDYNLSCYYSCYRAVKFNLACQVLQLVLLMGYRVRS